ncbi:Protein of unknown function [Modicisalibacter ilicicola DSM 19980]|uniref:DUF3549 domain-containing protein n=1 Tax=Modicisalibacter ilicicola DSM 19980 TaxID=1121942 RepID=A0A1M4S9T2_9GAMM|nr:DUF3549 family protein [Halomonas ilicicola]SHE28949.1 Protein of unknown function [Halomonas ilicicola DSM 19980]
MQPILSLGDFFTRIGATARFYTLGRQVSPCPAATLAAFEAGELAWPRPWLGHARLACVFRLGDGDDDPLIWFLTLPLDEQGFLEPAPRDAFLERLLESLGRSAQGADSAPGDRLDDLMRDDPRAFTPDLTQRAMLHAHASRDLQRAASEHLEPVEEYLTGQGVEERWQALGLQGLADFAVRHDAQQSDELASRLASLPVEVLRPLCHCLEHVTPSIPLARALVERGERAAAEGDLETFCACIRAVGQAPREVAGAWYDSLLDDASACGPDSLAAIAARGWAQLEDAERLPRFIERLADDQRTDFAAVVRDLALIPRLRLPLLLSLRQAAPGSMTQRRLAEFSHRSA